MAIVSGDNKRFKTTPEQKWVLQTKGTTENNRDEVIRGSRKRKMFVVGEGGGGERVPRISAETNSSDHERYEERRTKRSCQIKRRAVKPRAS